MAYGIGNIINGRISPSFGGDPDEMDLREAIEWAIFQSTSGADSINLSLKVGGVADGYSDIAQVVDFYVDTADVSLVKSAGNESSLGVTEPADAYNAIAVGNVQNGETVSTNDDVLHATSSWNPAGGRRMLDLVAPGYVIATSNKNGGISTGILQNNFTGTSMAAPHVTGGIALLDSVLSHEPYTIKAVLLNTATDQFNSNNTNDVLGWDRRFGYGYLNLYRAYYFRHYRVRSISPGQNLYFKATVSTGTGDFGKMTIVWHKHLNNVNDQPPFPLSNLDLRLYDYTNGSQGNLLASSTSTVDNVEQVISPTSGQVLVKITAVSTYNGGSEDFTLASMHALTEISSPAPAAVVSESEVIKDELGNNFPNPFNPETWIPFSIAKDADATIQIYNTRGRLVRTLDLGHRQAGRYSTKEKAAHWDGRNDQGEQVSSGTYFYYLEAGNFKAIRKMIVQK